MKFVGLVVVALLLLIFVIFASAALWYYVFWPLCFEQWLGPLPWPAAFGIGFTWASLNARGRTTPTKP